MPGSGSGVGDARAMRRAGGCGAAKPGGGGGGDAARADRTRGMRRTGGSPAPCRCRWRVRVLRHGVRGGGVRHRAGLTTDAGRRLGRAGWFVLPAAGALWAQVQAGAVPRAGRRSPTPPLLPLSPAAAGFVDRQVAIVARVSTRRNFDAPGPDPGSAGSAVMWWKWRTSRTCHPRWTPGGWTCTPIRCPSPAPSPSRGETWTWSTPCIWTRRSLPVPSASRGGSPGRPSRWMLRRATALGEMSRTRASPSPTTVIPRSDRWARAGR